MGPYDHLPLADPDREQWAREQFPVHELPEVYAARNAHLWGSFSFADYRYRSNGLNEWIQRLGDLLFQRNGAPTIAQLRRDHLSAQEISEIEAVECDQKSRGNL